MSGCTRKEINGGTHTLCAHSRGVNPSMQGLLLALEMGLPGWATWGG